MSATIDLTEDDFLTALRTFLLLILPTGVEVVQAQGNRVPPPKVADYIIMTPADRVRMSTNRNDWDRADPNAATMRAQHSTKFVAQLDLHGPQSSDNAQLIATLLKDYYGCGHFDGSRVTPLDATDGHQAPFQNAQGQWENRWIMEVHMQANPIVSTAQDFATTVAITLKPIEG